MRFEIKTYGSSPISVAQVKAYAKINTDADDDVIRLIIDAVVKYAERMTHRELRNNTWNGYADSFDEDLELRRMNVEQINKIEYLVDDVVTLVDNSTYYVDRNVLSSMIMLRPDCSWPSDADEVADAVQIEFTTSADMRLPELKLQMLKHITHAYENRGDVSGDASYGFGDVDYYKSSSIPNF